MRTRTNEQGTVTVEGNTPDARYRIVDHGSGPVVEVWEHKHNRPAQPIPADFDPEQERRRTQQGGCCGQPSDS